METKIYDKAAWHIENTEKSSVLSYFEKLMDFLKTHNYLNDYGLEIYALGVDTSLSITSKMLTEEGNRCMSSAYDGFLKNNTVDSKADFSKLG